jgi:hypothetical protein
VLTLNWTLVSPQKLILIFEVDKSQQTPILTLFRTKLLPQGVNTSAQAQNSQVAYDDYRKYVLVEAQVKPLVKDWDTQKNQHAEIGPKKKWQPALLTF